MEEKKEELKYTSDKKDWYCSWAGKWQCTPVFEVEAPIPTDDETE